MGIHLEGSHEELAKMLQELAYGDNAPPEMIAVRNEWQAKVAEEREAKNDHH